MEVIKMRTLLKDFWDGNITPQEQYTNRHPDITALLRVADKNLLSFSSTLTKTQEMLWQKYDNSLIELNSMLEQELFIYAFRLGGRFMLETLSKE